MPYRIEYPSTDTPYMIIALEDPLSDDDLQAMRKELEPLTETKDAHYVLADLRQFDFAQSFQRLLLATDGIPIPALTGATAHSRVAIVGGGPAIKMISGLMGKISSDAPSLIQMFKTLEEAEAWLRDEHQKAVLAD